MFISLFRILFVLLLGYLAYTVFRYIFQIGRSPSDNKSERLKRGQSGSASGKKNNKVIELDEDQYKVE